MRTDRAHRELIEIEVVLARAEQVIGQAGVHAPDALHIAAAARHLGLQMTWVT